MLRFWIPALLLTPALLIGCNRIPGDVQGNVAVVDLDEVAKQLGLSQQWSAELTAKRSTVNQKLVGYQQRLNEQLEKKRIEVVAAGAAESPLPESQQTQLVSYQQELNGKLQRAQEEAKKILTNKRSQIIRNFRRQAEQVSAEVAKQKGYDVVLTKNESVVLTYTPEADITKEVSEKMRAKLARREQTSPQGSKK